MLLKSGEYKLGSKEVNLTKMLILYRYISLALTSVFYIWGVEEHTVDTRLIVIAGMIFTAIVMHYLYMQNKGQKKKVGLLVIIETIGNCMILIPSGGLQSPYIWYILNTVILSGIELGSGYLWANVSIYLISMVGISYVNSMYEPITAYLRLVNFNLIAGFMLATIIIELLISHAKALEEKERQSKQYLDYTLRIYQTVYLLTAQKNRASLIEVILDYLHKTRKVSSVLFVEFGELEEDYMPYAHGIDDERISRLVRQIQEGRLREGRPREGRLQDGDQVDSLEVFKFEEGFIGIPIRHTHTTFGILIVSGQITIKELQFIGYVSGMIFKKIDLEIANDKLIVREEQNRIANEIHDSVIQQLFGVSCSLFTMTKNIRSIEEEQLVKELKDTRTIITQAMGELRETIYGMSWHNVGKSNFLEKLEGYIESMHHLHKVTITLEVNGNIGLLSLEEQKALYRVCCEAIANGIRHGKAKQITIDLQVSVDLIEIRIKDNGEGFDYKRIIEENKLGLGIKNMKELIDSLNGEINIYSVPGKGTEIDIHIDHKVGDRIKNIFKERIE